MQSKDPRKSLILSPMDAIHPIGNSIKGDKGNSVKDVEKEKIWREDVSNSLQRLKEKTNGELKTKHLMALAALELSMGNITEACSAVHINRETFHRWRNEMEAFARAELEIRESIIDMVECKLLEMVRKGNIAAVCFFLKCKGKSRGYIESPLQIQPVPPDPGDYDGKDPLGYIEACLDGV